MRLIEICHREYAVLHSSETVKNVLDRIQHEGLPHKIVYFYVVDDEQRLVGVVPVRALLLANAQVAVSTLVLDGVIALRDTDHEKDALLAFQRHRLLAFPVIDSERRLVGVIDIERFAGNLGNLASKSKFDDIYELLGLADIQRGRLWQSYRSRMPWLFTTISAGVGSALITSLFEQTLEKTILLAFFLTMILGLNEAVSMQSASISLRVLHRHEANLSRYPRLVFKELMTALMVGLSCGVIVFVISWLWKSQVQISLVVGASLGVCILLSSLWGFSVPFLIRKISRDPQVGAAPLALALTDVSTLAIYLGSAALFL